MVAEARRRRNRPCGAAAGLSTLPFKSSRELERPDAAFPPSRACLFAANSSTLVVEPMGGFDLRARATSRFGLEVSTGVCR